jgi:hypothetical protein
MYLYCVYPAISKSREKKQLSKYTVHTHARFKWKIIKWDISIYSAWFSLSSQIGLTGQVFYYTITNQTINSTSCENKLISILMRYQDKIRSSSYKYKI